jgi:SH3-like domain-containing protein
LQFVFPQSAGRRRGVDARRLAPLAVLLLVGLTAQAQELCVKVNKANLRSGPGDSYRVTWEAPRNMPLLQVGRQGDWLKVQDLDGDIHWVAQALVTADFRCVAVSAEKTQLRSSPSAKAASTATVARYSAFRRAEAKAEWVQVEFRGKSAWVSGKAVWPGAEDGASR